MFAESHILIIAATYFLAIMGLALAANKGYIPEKLLNHPMIFSLSLGGYTGTWAISGALTVANTDGYLFLSYFFGTSALFIFSPLIIRPLFSLTKAYRLSSLADLFSFRYESNWAGFIVALFVMVCVLPLMAIQFDKIAETAIYLIQPPSAPIDYENCRPWAWGFFIIITLLSLLLSRHQATSQQRNNGLVFTTAVQSFIKLFCFLTLGAFALFFIFNGSSDLEAWLYANPAKLYQLNSSIISNNARTLTVIFFAAALAFPHLFHLTFSENPNSRSIDTASWAFPAYLLLISLPILPILWAAQASGIKSADYLYALSLGFIHHNPWVMLVGFFCMLSAAATSLIVIAISSSGMCANHLILPYFSKKNQIRLFGRLGLIKQLLLVFVLLMSMLVLEWSKQMPILTNFSFAAFSAACQFLPGILALLYWPRGNRSGLVAGILAGFFCWLLAIILPMVREDAFGLMPFLIQSFSLAHDSYFTIASTACLGVNMLIFGSVSFFSKMDQEQHYAAEICSQDNLSLPVRQKLAVRSARQFVDRLSSAVGHEVAHEAVSRSIVELKMSIDETRPFALRLLRRKVEAHLSALYGPTVSRQVIAEHLPYSSERSANKDIRLIEQNLEMNKHILSGLAFELDRLRRYHRQTIEALPIGVCTLGHDLEILLWNQSLEKLTNQKTETLLGAHISIITEPWQHEIRDFLNNSPNRKNKVPLTFGHETRWFTFFKTEPKDNQGFFQEGNQTIIIEEVTETVLLENEVLHNERLASIGRLAAGVAHEIGNPVTGIACLAQNLTLDSDSPAIHDASEMITEQTGRIKKILQTLINFSHAGSQLPDELTQKVNVYHCAEDAIHLLSLENKDIIERINNDIEPTHDIKGDAQRILQVFINLLNNALFAAHNDTPVFLESTQKGDLISITVTDYGAGIPKAIQEQIFEPFFTTKEVGEGTGLGLSLVYSIIEDHHGSIYVKSPIDEEQARGTCFTIELPCYASTPSLAE